MRIVICDDIESFCEYYKKLFAKTEDIEVVGVARDSSECKDLVIKTKPDIVLLDIQMREEEEGLNVIEELLQIRPELKIIIFTMHKVEDYIFKAFAFGVKDFVSKTATDEEIIKKIFDVYNEESVLDPDMANVLAKKTKDTMKAQRSILYMINLITSLSKSELNVLRGVYYGKTYKEIAAERFVEEGTIRAQASGILRKFDAKSFKSLVKMLREQQLFEFIDLYADNNKN